MIAAVKSRPDQQFDSLVSWSMMLRTYLARRISARRSLHTVSVVFDTEQEAREFHRLLVRAAGVFDTWGQ